MGKQVKKKFNLCWMELMVDKIQSGYSKTEEVKKSW